MSKPQATLAGFAPSAQAASAQQRADVLEAVVRQLASTTPRGGEWERSYKALQSQARRALAERSDHPVI